MFVNWGVLVGEGTDNVKNFTSADQIFDLGRRLWGGAWIIILIAAAALLSVVAVIVRILPPPPVVRGEARCRKETEQGK
jgi:hypothetical protein